MHGSTTAPITTPWGGPGVWFIDDNVTSGNTSWLYVRQYPLLASSKYMGAEDDAWIVYPGFSVILYNANNYSGTTLATVDNTNGTSPISLASTDIYGGNNSVRSCRISYRGTQLNLNLIS